MESQRISERSLNPKFLETTSERGLFLDEQRPGTFDKKLEESRHYDEVNLFGLIDDVVLPPRFVGIKYTTNLTGVKLAVLDTLIELAYGADHVRIREISLKEVDSFLRDPGMERAFTSINKLVPLFEEVKKALQECLDGEKPRPSDERRSPSLNEDYIVDEEVIFNPEIEGPYQSLPESRRLEILDTIVHKHIASPLKKDGGAVEVVFADEFLAVIEYSGACVTCNKSLTSTMDYIQQVFQLETKHHSLRVITDS